MRFPWTKRADVLIPVGSAPRNVGVKGKMRVAAMMMRGFAAAHVDRMLNGWRFDGGFTPSEVSTHLEVIRGRSRQMAKDSPHFKRWLELSAVNIVGDGFSLKSTPHDGDPGKDWRLDESAAKYLEYHWWKFSTTASYCDATGRKTLAEIDRLNVKTWKRDGEYFMQILPASNPYGVTFRVLRPDWCDHSYNLSDTGRGTLVHCGVEMEIGSRRPVAYWFRTTPKNAYAYNGRGQPLIRIPASEIIHGFTQEDEDQPRGIPHAHASLVKLKMLEEYDRAELVAAWDEACSVRQYTADKPTDESAFVDLTADTKEAAAARGSLEMPKEPGQSEIVPAGWKGEVNTPQHPNREVSAYKSGMLKDLACGFGVEYSNWANDWAGVSFSSVRVGTISERDMWMVQQGMMIAQSKGPQFRAWLKAFLGMPTCSLPASKFDKFAEHEYRGRRWMWVDPMKDMAAAKMCVDNGWKTNTDVAADLGNDYGDNLEIMALEKAKRDKTGFVPVAPAGSSQAPQPPHDEGDEDEAPKPQAK